jgi:hypothetical protein
MPTGRFGPCSLRARRTANISTRTPWLSITPPWYLRPNCPRAFSTTTGSVPQFPGRSPVRSVDFRRNSLATTRCLSPGHSCCLELDSWRWPERSERSSLVHSRHYRHSGLSLERCLPAAGLGTHIPQHIPLPVETRDKHGTAVLVATRLVIRDNGWLIPDWSHVTQRFAEATSTKLIRAAEKLNRIIDAEWSQQELHGSIVLIAQRQDVGPHGGILASPAKQNRRPKLPV